MILELILSTLGFFASDSNDNTIDVTSDKIESEPKVLATSPSGNEKNEPGLSSQPTDSKKPTGDSDICKKLTDQAIEAKKQTYFNPIVTIEETDANGRKHVAVAAGATVPFLGDKNVTGCVSFPALPKKK